MRSLFLSRTEMYNASKTDKGFLEHKTEPILLIE